MAGRSLRLSLNLLNTLRHPHHESPNAYSAPAGRHLLGHGLQLPGLNDRAALELSRPGLKWLHLQNACLALRRHRRPRQG